MLSQKIIRPPRRPHDNPERGTTTIEFLMVLPLTLCALVSTFDVGLRVYSQLCVERAARAAAREALTALPSASGLQSPTPTALHKHVALALAPLVRGSAPPHVQAARAAARTRVQVLWAPPARAAVASASGRVIVEVQFQYELRIPLSICSLRPASQDVLVARAEENTPP